MRSIPNPFLLKEWLPTPLPTAAGDDAFSPKLKPWVCVTKEFQPFAITLADPQLARKELRNIWDEQLQRDTVSRPQIRPSIDISWFDRVMEPATGPLKPADIMPVIAGLTNMLKANYFEEVARLLKSVKVSDAAPEVMVALLRTTYPVRRKLLRHWSKLLKDVRAELSARHLDSDRILRGLA